MIKSSDIELTGTKNWPLLPVHFRATAGLCDRWRGARRGGLRKPFAACATEGGVRRVIIAFANFESKNADTERWKCV